MKRIIASFVAFVLFTSVAPSQVTQRVSVDSNGAQVFADCIQPSISADGRFVAFWSDAFDLAPGDVNFTWDVYLRDRQTGATVLVSVGPGGTSGDGASSVPSISADGRYVAFHSFATDLVPGDTNDTVDVFVRDLQAGTTERVSVDSSGAEADIGGGDPSISADGRFVAFTSVATNLVPGDTNGFADVFVHDRIAGTTRRVSLDSAGNQADGASDSASISGDARFVAFTSAATNLVAGDTNGLRDVFVRDRQSATTDRSSVASGGTEGNGESGDPSISGDGSRVAFTSDATNLAGGDTNGQRDIFLRDRTAVTTELVSVGPGGVPANGESQAASTSGDGRYVAFTSEATNLAPGDTNGDRDVFLRDRQNGTTERVNVGSQGRQANEASYDASISPDGRFVAFHSYAVTLVPAEANLQPDVFLRDRLGGPSFTSLCDPGVGAVISCPCSNPPSALGRGCDNSSSTGGAALAATGGTYVSSDSLVFTTSGEKPTALSILAQWTGGSATGAVFGMGVRCTSGVLKRLYTKSAVGGSITAPNFGAGDLQVSARSAALGNAISAGESRWYLVYYRDSIVLGGCPAASTFNATQTGQVLWSP